MRLRPHARHRVGASPSGPLVSGGWLPPALLPLAAAIIISVAPPCISSAEGAGLPTPEVLTRSQAVDKAGAKINELKSSVADKVVDFKLKVNLLEVNVPDVPDDPPLPPEPPPSPPPGPTGAQIGAQMTDAIAREEAAAELFETVVDPDELNSYYVLKGSSGSSAPKGGVNVKGGEGGPSEESARKGRGGKPRDESQEKRLEDEKRQKSAGVKFSKKKYSNAEVFQAHTHTHIHIHTYTYICIHICIHISISHIYICIHVHIHMHIRVHSICICADPATTRNRGGGPTHPAAPYYTTRPYSMRPYA